MKFIYINRGASPSKFENYLKKYNNNLQQQAQKYNQLLMEGLVKNGAVVNSISSRPIGRSIDKKIFFKKEKDTENGIDYHYVSFINFPILRNLTVFFNVFFKVLFMKKSKKETVVICDALNIAASSAACLAAKICGIHKIGIVTDVPCHRPNDTEPSLAQKINLWLMKRFDSYLLLTEQMSDVVNPKKRPYVVLEGHSDIDMANVENSLENKYESKVCLYAGSLRKIYGIGSLVDGFIQANVPNTELHIYGAGEFSKDLAELTQKYSNIKYFGIAPNTEVVQAELKSSLLVNPRPTGEDYTKYSFPSKNMEYMASGTPVLTTKLPGMPSDHLEHVYLIEKENAEGISEKLREILSKTKEELHEKGKDAKTFVLEEKNNIKQSKKLIDMIEDIKK